MKIVFPWRPALRLLERVVRDRVRYRGRGERLADDASYPTDQGHDYEGCPQMVYAQRGPGGFAAGEVIWTWVAYEEDRSQGKDRTVLLIGLDAGWLLGLPATSKDHDRDEAQEAAAGRYWMDIGAGAWDREGRPSEVRLNRLVLIPAADVRREGAALAPELYAAVIAAHARFA